MGNYHDPRPRWLCGDLPYANYSGADGCNVVNNGGIWWISVKIPINIHVDTSRLEEMKRSVCIFPVEARGGEHWSAFSAE
ncbi:hypothetical protein L484_013428 [Morus notabilis]|uniref:Uncharacterized protein n=1 Tax=Morus notabilis TaxID=981085 RepID=W9RKZ5_9ROSA|nr:hypothetical protein L484_013428 [Morus notabilis]